MRKIFLSSILILSFTNVIAQVSSLSENFNTSCSSSTGFPYGWRSYNPLAGTSPSGAWTCAPTEGRDGTSGILCTDTFGTPVVYHLDTSYLITPLLDLVSYHPDSVYLHFDSKATSFFIGGKLNIIVITDTANVDSVLSTHIDSNYTDSLLPLINEGDSSGWVTHQLNLTAFELRGPFYIAFRYSSLNTSGNTWYLDNINTSTTNVLHVAKINNMQLPLKVIGNATPDQITLSYTIATAGMYSIEMYDMMGRVLYKSIFSIQEGSFTYNISNLNIQPGMYFIKMGNGNSYGTAKVMIQ